MENHVNQFTRNPEVVCPTYRSCHQAKTDHESANFGRSLNHSARTPRTLADECSRIVRARIFECFWLSLSY